MAANLPLDEQLRAQIEAYNAERFSPDEIEGRIAAALGETGRFEGFMNAQELAIILRQLVYYMFARQKFVGLGVTIVHNIPTMKVRIQNGQAKISYVVHIHKPIVAFLEFDYLLVNDSTGGDRKIHVKQDSLTIKERTRRFDLKAKTALVAANVQGIARKELADLTGVIVKTIPPQLKSHGIQGHLNNVELTLHDQCLIVNLEGDFSQLPG